MIGVFEKGDSDVNIPEILLMAQELQKSGDFSNSLKLYTEFFSTHRQHVLRFKALFEIADNYFYMKSYNEAIKAYNDFINYCSEQRNLTEEEISWISAYNQLAKSRLDEIKK